MIIIIINNIYPVQFLEYIWPFRTVLNTTDSELSEVRNRAVVDLVCHFNFIPATTDDFLILRLENTIHKLGI
jgi:hypothetical protein